MKLVCLHFLFWVVGKLHVDVIEAQGRIVLKLLVHLFGLIQRLLGHIFRLWRLILLL